MYDTQLSTIENFDFSSIIFYRPEVINLNDSDNVFKKIKISVRNKDGSIGDLVFSAPKNLFSYGIQELKSDGVANGYIMPIALSKKREITPEESLFIETLEKIIELSIEQVKEYINKDIDIKRFSPLSYKKKTDETEEPEQSRSPILYTKLIFNKKDKKIGTLFIDEQSNIEVDPLSILNKRCYVTGAIKIESIFLGEKVTLQIKLYEAIIKVVKHGKRLLNFDKKPKPSL